VIVIDGLVLPAVAARGTLLALHGLVDAQRTAVDVFAVHLFHRLCAGFIFDEGDKSEAPGPTGVPISDNAGILDLAERLESLVQAVTIDAPT